MQYHKMVSVAGVQKVSHNKNYIFAVLKLILLHAVLKLILLHPGLYTNLLSDEYEEPDACFIPKRLLDPLNPAQNPCDRNVCIICQ